MTTSAPMALACRAFSRRLLSITTTSVRQTLRPPTSVSPSPVLPAVASTMVPPGLRRPSASAASIMVRAGRSLSEPEGFALSSLRNSRQGPRSMRVTSMRGVSPMRSSTDAMAVYSIVRPKTGRPASAGHPFDERPVHRVWPFHGGKMAAIGDDDEPRSGDAGGDLLRERRRSELIAVADEHEGRTLDRGQERPRITARHDRLLLAQERLRSGFLGHEAHALAQRFVALPVAMDEYRKLQRRHIGKSAGLDDRDLGLAPRSLLRRFGASRGVEQREPLDALGRVPHDGQGDVAAHREPGERKAWRRGGEDATCDRIHAVVAGVVGHLHRPESP